MLEAFRALYGLGSGPLDPWMRGLSAELRRQRSEGWDAERTILSALEAMGVAESHWEQYIEETLLSLRGWAGMIRQLELRPDTAPVAPPNARLADYLAVQLTLDLHAARHALRTHAGAPIEPADASARLDGGTRQRQLNLELVYEAFIVAQLAGVGPSEITSSDRGEEVARSASSLRLART